MKWVFLALLFAGCAGNSPKDPTNWKTECYPSPTYPYRNCYNFPDKAKP